MAAEPRRQRDAAVTRAPMHVSADAAALCDAAAEYFVFVVDRVVQARGRCRLALAGGGTPVGLYRLLASDTYRGRIPWPQLEVFWGDERMVPPTDPASNFRMAQQALLDSVPIPAERIHRIAGERDPAVAARDYAALLGEAPLDLVLLGMGRDGHTASLFPDTPDFTDSPAPVLVTRSPAPPPARVSLSLGTINAARAVAFLIAGADKADTLARVWRERESPDARLPAALVAPVDGALDWFVDEAAAAMIDPDRRGGFRD